MRKRGLSYSMIFFIFISITCIVLFSHVVRPEPPTPHNFKGWIYHQGTAGAGGLPVLVNNTNNSQTTLTYSLSFPPFAPFLGSYSGTINGSDYHNIIVKSWNSTHYGIKNATLSPTTTEINLTLDKVRPAEPNLTIIQPANDSLYEILSLFNVTANTTIIGGANAFNCNATISISDGSVFSLANGHNPTINIGDITLGSRNHSTWLINATGTGNSSFTVSSECENQGYFDNLHTDVIYNITAQDSFGPNVSLVSPKNDSSYTTTDSIIISFEYNVTDGSSIANCSLFLNGLRNLTNDSIEKNTPQFFSQNFSIGNYTWQVRCIDNSTSYNSGVSDIFNLSIIPNFAPTVTNMAIVSSIDLNIGSIKTITCNATVGDQNNISDIADVNSTLYYLTTNPNADDDNNNHYSNTSCRIVSFDTYEQNYSCSFPVQYYANNGTWYCNISAIDTYNETASNTNQATIEELVAINITPSVLDYGNLAALDTSQDINLTITNLGNKGFNISVDGYGIIDGDGLSMDCAKGDISLTNERYATTFNTLFASMTSLTDVAAQIPNFSIPQRTDDTDYGADQNKTFWKLQIPSSVKGKCNGTIFINTIII